MTTLSMAIATAVAFVAGAPTPVPTDPPPAERAFVCEWGNRHFYQWRVGYGILAGGCTGPEGAGPGTVTWTSGGFTHTYTCLSVVLISEDGLLGSDC